MTHKMNTDQALTLIALHFSEALPVFEEDELARLNFSKMLYLKACDKTDKCLNVVPDYIMSVSKGMNFENASFVLNGKHILFQGDTVVINGKKQETHVDNLQELEKALQKGYWIAVKRCLGDIIIEEQKKLFLAGNIEEAKKQALNVCLPFELRNELLGVIASSKDRTIIDWVLVQPSFGDSAKDCLIERLVDEALENDNTLEADKLIKTHLKSGSSAQESASRKLFYYHFNRSDFLSAENVVKNHFTKGYDSYERLIYLLFDHYFSKEDIINAERILIKHYIKGYDSYERLAIRVFDYYLNDNKIDRADEWLKNHYTKGYDSYERLAKRVFNYYLNDNKIDKAEEWLRDHYTKGYDSFDRLVEKLVDYLIERHKYREARDIVNRNLSKGYDSHTKLTTYILEQQVVFMERYVKD